jgi:phage-related protein
VANFRDLTVRLYIEANTEKGVAKSLAAFRKIAQEADQTQRHLDRANSSGSKTDGIFSKMANSLGSASRAMASAGASVAGFGAKLGVGVTAIGALGGAAATATAPVLGLVGARAPAAGIVAALPGAFVAAKAAMIIWSAATSAFGDAVDAALNGSAKKYDEAVARLGENAAKIVDQVRQHGDILDTARKQIENSFFQGFANIEQLGAGDVIQRLTNTWLRLRDAVVEVAGFMGNLAVETLLFVNSGAFINPMNEILRDMARSLATMQEALRPLLRGFMDLSAVGVSFIASFASGLADVTTRFGLWLSRISASGKALEWMNNAALVFKQLGILIIDLSQLLGGLIRAMQDAGLGTLGILGQLVGAMNEWVNSAEGQKVLIEVFTALHEIGNAFIPVILGIVQAIAGFAPVIARLASMAAPILINALNAIEAVLQALAPAFEVFLENFGFGIELLVPPVISIGQALAKVLIAVSPLIPAIASLAAFLGEVLANQLTKLVPYIGGFVDMLKIALQNLAPLGGAILHLAGTALQTLFQIINPLLPVLSELVVILGTFIVDAFMAVFNAIRPVLPALVEAIRLFGQQLANSLTVILPLLLAVIEQWIRLLPAILMLIPPLLDIATQIMPVLVNIFKAFLPYSEHFTFIMAEIYTRLIPLIPRFWELAAAFIPLALEATELALVFSERLLPVFEQLVPVIIPILEKIIRWFTWFFDELVGHSIIPDLVKAIAEWWQWGVDQVRRIIEWFTNIPGMFRKWLADTFGEVVTWLNRIVEFFAGLPGSIVATLAGLGATLYESGRQILQGLINGLWSMFDTVMNTVGDILGRIRAAFPFSPAKWGPFSGHGYTTFSGKALMRDFAKGIQSQAGIVDSALEDAMSHSFSPEMPSVSAQWSANVSGGMAGGGVVIQSLNLHFADDRDMYTKGKEFADGLREYRRRGGVLPT